MKSSLILFFFLTVLASNHTQAQIVGPTTAVSGSPVTFTSARNAMSYTWITDTMNYSGDFNPSIVSTGGFETNSLMKMVFDGTNYYAFYFSSASAMLKRLNFGTNPNSAPTKTDVVTITGIGTSNNKSIEIVRDSATGKWYGFVAGMKQIWRLDFGNSLSATPSVNSVMTLPTTVSNSSYDFVVIKTDGKWYGFVAANDENPAHGIVRLDFGNNLAGTPTTLSPAIKHTASTLNSKFMDHFTLHIENGQKYLLATNLDLGQLIRFDFGNSFDNPPSDGTIVYDGALIKGNRQPRSFFIISDCNELIGYVVNSNTEFSSPSMFVKMDFNGSILNTPTVTMPAGAANLTIACTNVSPYVYNDTLYLIAPKWQTQEFHRIKTWALPSSKTYSKAVDSSFTHTFATPGLYNLTLYLHQGGPEGPRAYCHQITVNPPGPAAPAQPGNFLTSTTSVCKGATGVEYRINKVQDATSYAWTYTPSTGVTITQVADTLVRLSFGSNASSGTLSVVASNITGNSPARTLGITVNDNPTVTLSPSGSRNICQGDSIELTATATTGVNIQWLQGNAPIGSGAPSLMVKTAGTYKVAVRHPQTTCVDTSGTLVVQVNPLPSSAINYSGLQNICEDDSLLLEGPSGTGYTYQWIKDGTAVGSGNREYVAKQTGAYRVVVSDANCTDTSQTVQVEVYTLPFLTLVPQDTEFCEGEAATLQVVTTDTGLNFEWMNNGVTIPQAGADFLVVQVSGVYTVSVERSILPGCMTISNTATVNVHELPTVTLEWDGEELHATPGFSSYQWYSDEQPLIGAHDSIFRPNVNGRYSVEVTDSNGCSATAVRQVTQVSVPEIATNRMRVYPNPASSRIFVDATVPVTILLFNVQGQLLRHTETQSFLEIGDLSEGVYFIHVVGSDGRVLHAERLLKTTTVH